MCAYHKLLKGSGCEDTASICPKFVDLCTTDVEYMKKKCPKTCGFCGNACKILK